NIPSRLELRPDASVPVVSPRQSDRVRDLLDGPDGLGGKIYIVGDGFVPNRYVSWPTPPEMDALVKQRYVQLLQQEHEARPEDWLDRLQMVLGIAGLIPLIGIPFDLGNTLISLGLGDVLGASLSVLAMIPAIGDAAQGANVTRRGLRAAELAGQEAKTA